jgi:hypothetical protein
VSTAKICAVETATPVVGCGLTTAGESADDDVQMMSKLVEQDVSE